MTEHEQTRQLRQADPRPRYVPYVGALALCAGLAIGGYLAVRGLSTAEQSLSAEEAQTAPPDQPPANGQDAVPYEKWERPLVALVLTGQMHGYIDPCGCSDPQYGGLVRRFNFVESLKAKKWDVVGIDLGEIAATQGIPAQRLLKFDLSIKALAAMNYAAFGIGQNEIANGLGEPLAQIYDNKRPHPRPLALTLDQVGKGQMFHELNVRGYEIVDNVKPKIGVISMMGPDFRDKHKQVKWRSNMIELPKALKAFADAHVEVAIVLHHEEPKVDPGLGGFAKVMAIEKARREQALECAKICDNERKKNPKIPPVQLMMLLAEDSEPPMFLSSLDPALPTKVLEIGHKGKYVGLVGIYREGKSLVLRHQNVLMDEQWKSPPDKAGQNAVIALMEGYNQQLKKLNMLAQYPRNPHINQIPARNQPGLRATFVGSDRCGDCHPQAYDIWKKTLHAKATDTLENLKHPAGRQFDPECMRCHTTGLNYPGGYDYPLGNLAEWAGAPANVPAAKLKKHNDGLRGVSCESCHGPASEHVKNPENKDLYQAINPFRPTDAERALEKIAKRTADQTAQLQQLANVRMRGMMGFCLSCHDEENDVKWGRPGEGVADKWQRLIHRTPPDNKQGAVRPAGGLKPPVVDDKK